MLYPAFPATCAPGLGLEERPADRRSSSDADADVLADYVLALLQHDGDVASIRKLCEEETKDFLKEEGESGRHRGRSIIADIAPA